MFLNELQDQIKNSDLLFGSNQIQKALIIQAEEINQFLESLSDLNQPPLVLPVMNGGLIYAGQLMPLIKFPIQVDYIHATRYRNSTVGHELDWKVHPQENLNGRVVIVLDDIFDEGHTLQAIVDYCLNKGASKVLTSVLVTKIHDRRNVKINTDFSALEVPDRYVYGYGMDFKGQLRNMNGIYALKEVK